MPYTFEQIAELDILIHYNLDTNQQGIKAHRKAAEQIAASCEARAAELVAQPAVGRPQ